MWPSAGPSFPLFDSAIAVRGSGFCIRYPPYWQWVCLCVSAELFQYTSVCITLSIVCLFASNAAAVVVVCCCCCCSLRWFYILICLLFVYCLWLCLYQRKNGKKCNSNRSVKICMSNKRLQCLHLGVKFKLSLFLHQLLWVQTLTLTLSISLFLFVCRLLRWVSFYINSFTFVSTNMYCYVRIWGLL